MIVWNWHEQMDPRGWKGTHEEIHGHCMSANGKARWMISHPPWLLSSNQESEPNILVPGLSSVQLSS